MEEASPEGHRAPEGDVTLAAMLCVLAGHRIERDFDGERVWDVCRRCGHVGPATALDADERAYGAPRDLPNSSAGLTSSRRAA